jgi:hypothetical protein
MTIETVILAGLLAAGILLIRAHLPLIRNVWHQARWYEKAGLLLALAPIPGPFDELMGVLVIRRIVKRTGGR